MLAIQVLLNKLLEQQIFEDLEILIRLIIHIPHHSRIFEGAFSRYIIRQDTLH